LSQKSLLHIQHLLPYRHTHLNKTIYFKRLQNRQYPEEGCRDQQKTADLQRMLIGQWSLLTVAPSFPQGVRRLQKPTTLTLVIPANPETVAKAHNPHPRHSRAP
jgi:hypothetical protein